MIPVLAGCGDDGAHPPPAVVEVRASGCSLADGLAAGTIVGDGLVLTVAHVVRGAAAVTVDGRPGEVVAVDHRLDAAVIAADVDGPPAHLSNAPALGVASLPTGGGRVVRLVDVVVDEPRDGVTYRREALVIDAEIVKGDSGSPVWAHDGAVVGMVFATSTGRDDVAYAVSSTELAPLLANLAAGPADTGAC